ncbi:hypothetical protein D3C76_1188860 [compost metagenome]
MLLQKLLACHQYLATVSENLHHQIAVLQRWEAQAQCDVISFTDDINLAIETLHVEFNTGALSHEFTQ